MVWKENTMTTSRALALVAITTLVSISAFADSISDALSVRVQGVGRFVKVLTENQENAGTLTLAVQFFARPGDYCVLPLGVGGVCPRIDNQTSTFIQLEGSSLLTSDTAKANILIDQGVRMLDLITITYTSDTGPPTQDKKCRKEP
jgi:hypothetical protein